MTTTRRNVLMSTLFGAGYLGLRSLVTGIPTMVLARAGRASAAPSSCPAPDQAQFVIMQTSSLGDPLNANAPGTYFSSGTLSTISHNLDPMMAPTAMMIGGTATMAAAPWAQLPQAMLDRTTVWHIMTDTPVHPREPDVLKLMGATDKAEMLPSLLSARLQPCLGTIQAQPITLGATSPSEGLSFQGQAQPIIPPLALKDTLTSPAGLANLRSLQALRDDTLKQVGDVFRSRGTLAQKAYLDSLVLSQHDLRSINQDLLSALGSIADNSSASQITAAIVLIQMKITPVVTIHIPFGGDNHADAGLAKEAQETVDGLASIAALMQQLQSAGLADQVTFASLNVFGRTLAPSYINGRNHNQNHQVSLTIGKPWRGGIVGGVAPVGNDFGAMAIDSTSGAGKTGGDVAPGDSLASFGKTLLTGLGLDSSAITSGTVIKGALA